MLSVNAAMQVDLFAQANASFVDEHIHSGFGGQPDFVSGALHSPGGHAVVALHAWHDKTDASTVVPVLRNPVTSFQHSAIVSEHGCAELFGRSQHARPSYHRAGGRPTGPGRTRRDGGRSARAAPGLLDYPRRSLRPPLSSPVPSSSSRADERGTEIPPFVPLAVGGGREPHDAVGVVHATLERDDQLRVVELGAELLELELVGHKGGVEGRIELDCLAERGAERSSSSSATSPWRKVSVPSASSGDHSSPLLMSRLLCVRVTGVHVPGPSLLPSPPANRAKGPAERRSAPATGTFGTSGRTAPTEHTLAVRKWRPPARRAREEEGPLGSAGTPEQSPAGHAGPHLPPSR